MAIPCTCCHLDVVCETPTSAPNLLANGNLEQSTGTGATSSIGPGWQSDYAPCGPSLFAAPCGGGNYAFFTTNAGQVTNNFGNSQSFPAKGTRSMAVNVSSNLAARIIYWTNVPLINGKSYTFECDAGQINAPFSVALRIDGNIITPITSPNLNAWTHTKVTFVWTGTTGLHTVSLNSNSGVLGGNDHVFDNFSLSVAPVPVFGFLCDGQFQWYDPAGNLIPDDQVVCRDSFDPNQLLTLNWSAFDDGAGLQESIGNMNQQPFSTFNANIQAFPDYYGSINPAILTTFNWQYQGSPVEFDYSFQPGTAAGASLFNVSFAGNAVTWPVLGELAVGAFNDSNPLPNGKKIRLTAVSGPNGSRPRWDNTTTVRIGNNAGMTVPVRVRFTLI